LEADFYSDVSDNFEENQQKNKIKKNIKILQKTMLFTNRKITKKLKVKNNENHTL
jgi:hypothetical protein